MSVNYYKRYRMEVDLRQPWGRPTLPPGYRYAAWNGCSCENRVADHAYVTQASFSGEIDSQVFHCLGEVAGCHQLMQDISQRSGFLPEATWLIEHVGEDGQVEPCGSIQGVRVTPRFGGIQNVGVTPWRRGLGLGKALVQAALFGFQAVGLKRAYLEVTSQNSTSFADV